MGQDWAVDVRWLASTSTDTLNHPLQVATDGFDCNLKNTYHHFFQLLLHPRARIVRR